MYLGRMNLGGKVEQRQKTEIEKKIEYIIRGIGVAMAVRAAKNADNWTAKRTTEKESDAAIVQRHVVPVTQLRYRLERMRKE